MTSTAIWIAVLVALAAVALLVRLGRRRSTRRSETSATERGEAANPGVEAEPMLSVDLDCDPFALGGNRGDHKADPFMPPSGTPPPDRVEASALVPRSVARGEVGRIEAVLARRGGMARALAKFSAGRDELLPAPARELAAPLARNTVLELTLECAQADLVTPKLQRLQWTGAPLTAGFQVRPSADIVGRTLFADLNVFVDRICVGHLPLTLPVVEQAGHADASSSPAAAPFDVARRLFMSYTDADRAQVLPIARALKEIGVEAFMDRLSLEGGEDWESRLWTEIDACDCFMLFWSKNSAASLWVQRETLHALNRQRGTPQRRPKIVTHLLGKPPPAAPPTALASLHFNDPVYAAWEAAVAAGEA